MPDSPRSRTAPPPGVLDVGGGAVLGLAVGVLGTATHLNLAPLSGVWTLPWGAALALLLAGSTQRWWMNRVAARGGRPLPAGAAVAVAAFTAAVALYRLPATDQLGLPWTPFVFSALPGAGLASVAWIVGLPVLGVLLLAVQGRSRRRRPGTRSRTRNHPRTRPRLARGKRVGLTGPRNPQHRREVDGQP